MLAAGLMKAVRLGFGFAIRDDHHDRNPAADVNVLSGSAEGWQSWTLPDMDQYAARRPLGTTARLAISTTLTPPAPPASTR